MFGGRLARPLVSPGKGLISISHSSSRTFVQRSSYLLSSQVSSSFSTLPSVDDLISDDPNNNITEAIRSKVS